MIILLYGPDDYRREEKKRRIIYDFKKRNSALGIAYFDCTEEGGTEKLFEFIANQSIFGSKKLAVIEHVFEAGSDGLAKKIEELEEDMTVTLLLSEQAKPLKEYHFLLKKPVFCEEVPFLTGARLKEYSLLEAEKRNVTLVPDALEFLLSVYKNSTWALITELDTLSSLPKSPVKKKDLEELGLGISPTFWELMNGFRSASVALRLKALERIFGEGEPGAKIFNILSAQFPQALGEFAAYDRAIKSGKIEYEEALLDFTL